MMELFKILTIINNYIIVGCIEFSYNNLLKSWNAESQRILLMFGYNQS